jgi:hypothetical protein
METALAVGVWHNDGSYLGLRVSNFRRWYLTVCGVFSVLCLVRPTRVREVLENAQVLGDAAIPRDLRSPLRAGPCSVGRCF